jgi:hypothetical protein
MTVCISVPNELQVAKAGYLNLLQGFQTHRDGKAGFRNIQSPWLGLPAAL